VNTRIPWRQHLTVAFVIATSCNAAQPATQTAILKRWEGDAVSVDSPRRKFRWSVERCGSRLRSEWRDVSGALVAWDEVTQLGAAASRYDVMRIASAQSFSARFQSREIVIDSAVSGRNLGREHVTTKGEAVIAGPMMIAVVQEHLPRLRAGQDLVRSYLVPEQSMVLRLLARRSQTGTGGSISVLIQAAAPLLRPFVPTTILEFDGHDRLVRSSGRILPLRGAATLTTLMQPDQQPERTCEY
jgi:hypothetical protein